MQGYGQGASLKQCADKQSGKSRIWKSIVRDDCAESGQFFVSRAGVKRTRMLSCNEFKMPRHLLQATLQQAVKEGTRFGQVSDVIVCQSAGLDVIEVQVQSAVDSAEVVLVQNMSGNQLVCKTKHRRKSSNLKKGKFLWSSRKAISLHSSWAYPTQFVSGRKAPRAVATARGRSIHHSNPGLMVTCPPMWKKSHGTSSQKKFQSLRPRQKSICCS